MSRIQSLLPARARQSTVVARGLPVTNFLALAFALVACGDPSEDPNTQQPIGSPVTTPDAGVVAMDAGAPPAAASNDSGAPSTPLTPVDAGKPDTGSALVTPVIDAQVPALDSGALADAGPGEGGVAAEAGAPRMDLGKGTGKDVITIGDSWMRLSTTGIQESLVKASGNQPYRMYGIPGTRMLDGAIPGQYTSAKRADPNIKTVVMTGGGNDIIQNASIDQDCTTGGATCMMQLEKIGKALSDLWAQMSKDGVQDVIHVMYSSSAGKPMANRDANNKMMADSCAAVAPPLRCHLLNTDMIITKSNLRSDGIHPTDAGYDAIGKAVFDLMVKEGMRR